jgi:hypothetical protein
VFGADFVERDTERFAGASFHFIPTALNAAQGINPIVWAQSARFERADIFAEGMLFCFTPLKMNSPASGVKWERGRFPRQAVSSREVDCYQTGLALN